MDDLDWNDDQQMRGKSLLNVADLTKPEFLGLVDLAERLRTEKRSGAERQRMVGRNIALIFEKASTRTRCAFEVAAHDQGAQVTYLGPEGSHIGVGESMKDTARVLGRMFDGIEYRGFSQESVETLARFSGVPVWNGLTDQWHPTQMLADILTMRDHAGKPLDRVGYCYLGDARNNTANSLLVTGALLGMDVRIAAPRDLWPTSDIQVMAKDLAAISGARIHLAKTYSVAWRAPTSCTPMSGCPWESRHRNGRSASSSSFPTRSTQERWRRRAIRMSNSCTASLPCTTPTVISVARSSRNGTSMRWRSPTRSSSPLPRSSSTRPRTASTPSRRPWSPVWATEMLIVAALGGNALLERGEVPIAETEEKHILDAVEALAPLGREHDLVITHGNGPQVGLLALESASDPALPHPYPFDVLGAQTQGMIGYFLLQAFENAMPGQQVVSLICQTLVDADDPGIPTSHQVRRSCLLRRCRPRPGPFSGLADPPGRAATGGGSCRHPNPSALVELATIRMLLADGALVICAGGGGIPVVRGENGQSARG